MTAFEDPQPREIRQQDANRPGITVRPQEREQLRRDASMEACIVSEVLIAGAWLWFAALHNFEKANRWPSWLPPERLRRSLHVTAIVVLWATVAATYAWTILNLGTSARTTNIVDPPGIGEDGLVWRAYLGAVVLAGGAYVMVAVKRIAGLTAVSVR